MNYRTAECGVSMALAGLMCAAGALLYGGPTDEAAKKSAVKPKQRLSVAAAKERAEMMHHIYLAMLDVMHHHYFHANRAVLPARAMEDVFADVADATNSTAKWISVNTKAMSVDHTPDSDFERRAAAVLANGTAEITTVEDGYFRRAGSVPLGLGCISCHTGGSFAPPQKTPRFAGLVISIPVLDE